MGVRIPVKLYKMSHRVLQVVQTRSIGGRLDTQVRVPIISRHLVPSPRQEICVIGRATKPDNQR